MSSDALHDRDPGAAFGLSLRDVGTMLAESMQDMDPALRWLLDRSGDGLPAAPEARRTSHLPHATT